MRGSCTAALVVVVITFNRIYTLVPKSVQGGQVSNAYSPTAPRSSILGAVSMEQAVSSSIP